MIRSITPEEIDNLGSLFTEYLDYREKKTGQPSLPVKDRLKNGLINKTVEVFVIYDEKERPSGFGVTQPSEKNINLIYVRNHFNEIDRHNFERKLFNSVFDRFKKNRSPLSPIRFAGQVMSTNLKRHAVNQGFQHFKRAKMSIERATITSLDEPRLPGDLFITSWESGMRKTIAKMLVKSHFNDGYVDSKVFPQWTSLEGCISLLEEIESSKYGNFAADHARVMKNTEDEHIGLCILTTFSNKTGYIPEIALSEAYRGRGLGKQLLVHSMKHYISREPEIQTIELDVTLKNKKAAKLYEFVGFKKINEYSVFVWNV